MAISGERIKALREARAGSQAHLAEAAALGLRTIQRVEAEGRASAETRPAIAAALDVSVETLNLPGPAAVVEAPPAPPAESAAGVPIVFATSAACIVFASHFGAAGDANGYLSRDQFVACMVVVLGVLPSLMLWAFTRVLRRGKLNIPNACFWLAEPQRAGTERWLHAHFAWLCVGLTLFLSDVFWLVAAANRDAPAHPVLEMPWMLGGLVAFLAAMTA
jgi:hypothetical protein